MLSFSLRARLGALSLDAAAEVGKETLCLVGPSGAGKTSLLRLLLGVTKPEGGRVRVESDVLYDSDAGIDLPPERRGLGYVPQDYALFPHLSAKQNVAFGLRATHLAESERRAAVDALLDRFGLRELADRKPALLSGGERQRVALARALATRPRALLLDEPLSALDVARRRSVRASLAEHLRSTGLPTIVVTHDPVDAAALGQRIAVMEAGRIVQVGTFDELASRPASTFVAEFTGGRLAPPR